MEIMIKPVALPEKIEWGRAEVAEQVAKLINEFSGVIYEDQKTAKKDKATLNKAKKELDDKRKEVKNIYTAPLQQFEKEVKELTGMIDDEVERIDGAVAEFEVKRRVEKREKVEKMYSETEFPFEVTLAQIENPKWMNASYKESDIAADLKDLAYHMWEDMDTLNKLPNSDLAKEYYKKTLNLAEAIRRAEETAEITKRAAAEESKAEEVKAAETASDAVTREEGDYFMTITVMASKAKLKALKEYIVANGIRIV